MSHESISTVLGTAVMRKFGHPQVSQKVSGSTDQALLQTVSIPLRRTKYTIASQTIMFQSKL